MRERYHAGWDGHHLSWSDQKVFPKNCSNGLQRTFCFRVVSLTATKLQHATEQLENSSFSTIIMKLGAWCHNSQELKFKPAMLKTPRWRSCFTTGNNKSSKQGNTTALPWNPALQLPVLAVVLVAAPDVDVASLLLVFRLAQPFPMVTPLTALSSITFFGPVWPVSMNLVICRCVTDVQLDSNPEPFAVRRQC